MAAKGGSSKGTPFERTIARAISAWWSNGERADLVWRTAQSGGMATTRSKTNTMARYSAGDLGPTDSSIYPLFDLLLFEVKRGYNSKIDVLDLVDGNPKRKIPNVMLSWMEKAKEDTQIGDRLSWVIIFKRDRKKECVLMERTLLDAIVCACGTPTKEIKVLDLSSPDISIILLDDFFEIFKPDCIARVVNEYEDLSCITKDSQL